MNRRLRPISGTFILLWLLAVFGCATTPSPDMVKGPGAGSDSRRDQPQVLSPEGKEPVTDQVSRKDSYKLMAEVKKSLERGQKGEIQQAQRLIQTVPDSPYTLFLAGSIYLRNGDIESARNLFTRSAELDPTMTEAFSALAEISLKTGDLPGADQYYLNAYTAAKTPATANRLALLRIRGGHLESAREILFQALEDFPKDVMTRNNLALAMDMMGTTSEGIGILSGEEIADPQLIRTRALLQLKEGRPDRAIADMENVFDSASSHEEWLLMGTADLQQGKLGPAEGKFRSAIAAGTLAYEGYLNLGLTLRRQGKFTEAEKVYLEGLTMASHPDLHLNLGVLYELYRGEPALALEHYREYLLLEGPASDRVREWVQYLEGVVENQ